MDTSLTFLLPDLRETSCTHNLHSGFASCQNDTLYHPSTLLEAAEELSSLASLSSSPNAYFLHVNSLHYSQPSSQYRSSSSVAREDTYVVLPSTGGEMVHGNSEALVRRQAAVEEEIKYERNLAEWRKRHEKLQDSELWMDFPVKGEPRRMRNEFAQSIVRNAQETKRRLSEMVCRTSLVVICSSLINMPHSVEYKIDRNQGVVRLPMDNDVHCLRTYILRVPLAVRTCPHLS